MPTRETVCARGFLPKELPPQFNSVSYGAFVAAGGGVIPAPIAGHTSATQTGAHSLARYGLQRRQLGIPNPITFAQLAECIVSGWRGLVAAFGPSSFSLTTPADRPAPERPFDRLDAFASRASVRARVRSTSRFLVRADVARFYPSIYTHSIPWALHTKAVAKQQRNAALLGNQIDILVRRGQDGQSVGVPVGPDTSLVIAEVILAKVDAILVANQVVNGLRIIDDYEIGTRTLADANHAVEVLSGALREYELDLNGAKTTIRDLPQPYDSLWAGVVKGFALPAVGSADEDTVLRFFDLVFEQATRNPEDPVVSSGIRRASHFAMTPEGRQAYERALLQCALTEPASLRFVIPELVLLSATGLYLDVPRLEAVLDSIIRHHAPLGHGSEVSWAVTGLMHVNRPLTIDGTKAVSVMDDPVVALCALDARSRHLVPPGTAFTEFAAAMTTDDLLDKRWLLAYEASVQGWLPSAGGGDHIGAQPAFASLRAARVSFYDRSVLPMRAAPTPADEDEDLPY